MSMWSNRATARTVELTRRWAEGYTDAEVAAEHHIAPRTVKAARESLAKALDVTLHHGAVRGRREMRAAIAAYESKQPKRASIA